MLICSLPLTHTTTVYTIQWTQQIFETKNMVYHCKKYYWQTLMETSYKTNHGQMKHLKTTT